MSYCRWSSDDFRCDLYCYETNASFVIEVKTHRLAGDLPRIGDYPLNADQETITRWVRAEEEQSRIRETLERLPIGLPHDGASIWVKTLGEFRQTLRLLRSEGYNFPDYVLEEVEREIVEYGVTSGPEAL